MNDRLNDFALAVARLQRLFIRADRAGQYPHELDPATFYAGWSLLNRQPLEVRRTVYEQLVERLKNPRLRVYRGGKNAQFRPQ